jgi:hypothetical protein
LRCVASRRLKRPRHQEGVQKKKGQTMCLPSTSFADSELIRLNNSR